MIIKSPTALYSSVLPDDNESGNITFTISNNKPPRNSLLFTELPPAIEQRQRSQRTISPEVRRSKVADRTFTVTNASQSTTGSNKKIVEPGQILEFTTGSESNLNPMLITKDNETQHNTNVLDFESLNISTTDQAVIADTANRLFEQFNEELNTIIINRQNTEIKISENKKLQNENRKATEAIQLLVSSGASSLAHTLATLRTQATQLTTDAATYIAQANEYAEQAVAKRDQIRELAQVVR